MEHGAETVYTEMFGLLRAWCDALLSLQIDAPADPARDGAFACPACGRLHGRCHEAAYPLLFLAEKTGEERYLNAARRVFRWGEILLEPDGGMKNDIDSQWKGVTAFAAVSLHDALYFHGDLLAAGEKREWEARLAGMGAWLSANLMPGAKAYINYYAANACAMALLGRYFNNDAYLRLSAELADCCAGLLTESGLLAGEGRPHDAFTEKGCRPVDIAYNAEESLPMLYRCSETLGDSALLGRCEAAAQAHLDYMLPDGGWDNSMGTRAFKWAYWGSRTADGATDLLFALGKKQPVFAEAAWRNFELLKRCTRGGLLYGGPDYSENGEKACVHHTFCRAKSLAAAMEAGVYGFPRLPLPCEALPPLTRVPETDTLRLHVGQWLADITAYDFYARPGAHVTGGCVSLLWHAACGPVFAAGMADYTLLEPNNQQLPAHPAGHRTPCPRLEAERNGIDYAQHRNAGAVTETEMLPDGVRITVRGRLCDTAGTPLTPGGEYETVYTLTPEAFRIEACTQAENAVLVLPVIAPEAEPEILRGTPQNPPEAGFCLTPGFRFSEHRVKPDAGGACAVRISVQTQKHGEKIT